MKTDKSLKDQQTLIWIPPVEVPDYSQTVVPEKARLDNGNYQKKPLLVLQHIGMGHVDPPAGTELLAGLISQMLAMEAIPVALILQGAAVRLTVDQNAVMNVLARMISLNVPVLICQESLKSLDLKARLEGARTIGQREIADQMMKAEKILWL